MPNVKIEGVGVVKFPDSMTQTEIENAIRTQILKQPVTTAGVGDSPSVGQFRAGVEESLLDQAMQVQSFEPGKERPEQLQRFDPVGDTLSQVGMLPLRAARGLVGLGTKAISGKTSEELIQQRQESLPAAPEVGQPGRIPRTSGRITGAGLPFLPLGAAGGLRGLTTELGATAFSGVGGGVGEAIGGKPGEVIGTLAGALSPAATAASVRGLARGGREGREFAEKTIQRSERIGGRTPTLGEISKRRGIRGAQNIIRDSVIFGPRINKAVDETVNAIEKQIENITSSLSRGGKSSPARAGRVTQKGIDDFVFRSRSRERSLHKSFQELVPLDQDVVVASVKSAMDDIAVTPSVRGILDDPKLPTIKRALLEDDTLAIPYAELQRFRTLVGNRLSSSGLLADIPRGDLKRLYRGASEAMLKAAENAGPEAVKRFRVSNAFSKRLHDKVDNTLGPLAKKKTFEDVFRTIMSDAVNRGSQVARTLKALSKPQRRIVAGSIIANLGKVKPGIAIEGTDFALDTFLTNWNKITRDPNSKKAILGAIDDRTFVNALDDVVATASNIRQLVSTGANPSGTAARALSAGGLLAIPGSAAIGAFLDPTLATFVGGVFASGRMASVAMSSPTIVKWMARSTRIPLRQIPRHIAQLQEAVRDKDVEVQQAAQAVIKNYNAVLNTIRSSNSNKDSQ